VDVGHQAASLTVSVMPVARLSSSMVARALRLAVKNDAPTMRAHGPWPLALLLTS
jgi:hypothetical protein